VCDGSARQRWARPRWRALYAIVTAAAVAAAITRAALSASLVRAALLVTIPALTGVALAVWIATNRVALDLADWCDCAERTVRVRVIDASVPAPPAVPTRRVSAAERTTLQA
jgi:hypothetical protein